MQPDTGACANVPDFIYGMAPEIGHGHGIGRKLDQRYAPDVQLHAACGVSGSVADETAVTAEVSVCKQIFARVESRAGA